MSITDGPIWATDSSNPEATTSSSNWIVGTKGDTIRIMSDRTPSGPNATGYKGAICWSETHLYVCVANGSWKRVALYNLLWV